MAYDHILYESRGGVGRLTLNRPDRLNSFNDAMHAEVRDALAAARGDASVRVDADGGSVIVTLPVPAGTNPGDSTPRRTT